MTAIDPVCGMTVETETAKWKSESGGQTYYFCSPGCQRSFEKDPLKYTAGSAPTGPDQPGSNAHSH